MKYLPTILVLLAGIAGIGLAVAQVNPKGNSDTEKLPDYLVFGLMEPYRNKALQSVFGRYGVAVNAVAGCVVTESLLENVAHNNDSLFLLLSARYGSDIKKQILAEVAARTGTQRRIEDLLWAYPLVAEQQKRAEASNTYLFFDNYAENGAVFTVKSVQQGYVNGSVQRSAWKTFSVDTLRGTVTVMPD